MIALEVRFGIAIDSVVAHPEFHLAAPTTEAVDNWTRLETSLVWDTPAIIAGKC
jgi:hypothetical protein